MLHCVPNFQLNSRERNEDSHTIRLFGGGGLSSKDKSLIFADPPRSISRELSSKEARSKHFFFIARTAVVTFQGVERLFSQSNEPLMERLE